MRQEPGVEQTTGQYADMAKYICFIYMRSESDTEDVFQDVSLKYALFPELFDSEEHEKARSTRVTVNRCKDSLRGPLRTRTYSLEEAVSMADTKSQDLSHVLESVTNLPSKYRIIVYLYHHGGHSAVEITGILHKNVNTIYTHLLRTKAKLKKMLGDDEGEIKHI